MGGFGKWVWREIGWKKPVLSAGWYIGGCFVEGIRIQDLADGLLWPMDILQLLEI